MDKAALNKIVSGVYVVGSTKEGKLNGQIINSLIRITADPVYVAISINKNNLTCDYIRSSGVFSVSMLSTGVPMTFIGLFGFKSGREVDKFAQTHYRLGKTGAPIVLDHTVAWMEGRVTNAIECETHIVFIGELVDYDVVSSGEVLTYEYYSTVMKGKSSKNAPTYTAPEEKKAAVTGQKYTCSVCGYEYDPAVGDPEHGIPPGTAFADLPSDWTCPVCGADKSQFEPSTPLLT